MKYILLIFLISIFTNTYSQCEYSVVEYDNSTGKGIIKSLPITLDYYETPFNGRIILAFLAREGNQYFIELEITYDSSSQDLEPICFEKGARLSFSLKNNSITSISQIEDKICGVKTYDRRSEYTTVSNYARFILTQESFDELVKSEVVLMKITGSDYQKNFVIKDEIEENLDGEIVITNPSRFFINNVECMTNPKFK